MKSLKNLLKFSKIEKLKLSNKLTPCFKINLNNLKRMKRNGIKLFNFKILKGTKGKSLQRFIKLRKIT